MPAGGLIVLLGGGPVAVRQPAVRPGGRMSTAAGPARALHVRHARAGPLGPYLALHARPFGRLNAVSTFGRKLSDLMVHAC